MLVPHLHIYSHHTTLIIFAKSYIDASTWLNCGHVLSLLCERIQIYFFWEFRCNGKGTRRWRRLDCIQFSSVQLLSPVWLFVTPWTTATQASLSITTNLEPVCCSTSISNCCFLACIEISQEAGQVVWDSFLFQNFPQFIVIHTVKGFGIVNKAEIDVFLELSCFFDDPADVGSLVPLPFLKPTWTSGSSRLMYCRSLAWRILIITWLAFELSAVVR